MILVFISCSTLVVHVVYPTSVVLVSWPWIVHVVYPTSVVHFVYPTLVSLVSSTSHILYVSMSANNRRSLRDLSDDCPFHCEGTSTKLSRQGRTVNGGNVDDSAPSRSIVLPSGDSVVAPVNVTEYIDKLRLFLNALQLAAMHHNDDKLDSINAR